MIDRGNCLKRIATVVLCFLLVLSVIPWIGSTPVYADDAAESVAYVDATGSPMGSETCTILTNDMTSLSEGWYAVKNSIEIGSRVTLARGSTVNLILCDGATLTLPNGLDAWSGTKLTIWGQTGGSGRIVANTPGYNTYCSAIGGSQGMGAHPNDCSSGEIIINGGTVEAETRAGWFGAAIGGGNGGNGRVTINGGTVRAVSNGPGAAIGGGNQGTGINYELGSGFVTINGGDVTAIMNGYIDSSNGGWSSGAAIGAGQYGGHAVVTITGGTVNAVSRLNGAAIGNGIRSIWDRKSKATIVISGGIVNATANNSYGIGAHESNGPKGSLIINGGAVTASGGTGIGAGMDTRLTHEEGNPVTQITANSYAGSVTTIGVFFYNGNELLPPGETNNALLQERTITAHVVHDYVLQEAKAPSYNGTYENGCVTHYYCQQCGQYFIKEGETYRQVDKSEVVIPYFEFGLDPDGNVAVTGYNGQDANIVIPAVVPQNYPDESLRGEPVKTIGEKAFYKNEVIRSVTAGDSIVRILWSAFESCPNLETASFGAGVDYIGGDAFYNCGRFTRLEIRSRKTDVFADVNAFIFSNNLIIYGYHGTGIQEIAESAEVPFYCLDQHVMNVNWRWTVTNSETGLDEGTATFSCWYCDREESVPASGEVLTAAACTTAGSARYSASFTDEQGKTWNDFVVIDITAQGHKVTLVKDYTNGSPATCTTDGRYDLVQQCERCGLEITRRSNITERAFGHSYKTDPDTAVPATCTQPGRAAGKRCVTCGDVQLGAVTSPRGHDWSSWVVTKAATETEQGQKTRYCSRCEATETTSIPVLAHVHRVSKVEAKAATCTATGNIEYYVCDQGENPCRRYYVADADGTDTIYLNGEGSPLSAREVSAADVVIPATGEHTWKLTEENPPFHCSVPGTRVYTCTVCGETKEEEYMAEHSFVEETQVIQAPTCELPGTHLRYSYCTVCGEYEYYQTVIDEPLGHAWSEWTVTKEATAAEEGEETRTCSRCGETETRVIPVILQVTRVAEKAAACEETGNYEYYLWNPEGAVFPRYFVADNEGTFTIYDNETALPAREVFRSEILIPKLEHSWNEGTVTTQPTCSEEGVMTYTCTLCGAVKTEAIEKTAHVPASDKRTEVVLEPGWDFAGYHWEITCCSVCDEELERELVEDPPIGSEEDLAAPAQINGVTASFNDRIKLNYYFNLPADLLEDEGAYVILTNESTGKSVTVFIKDAELVSGRGYKFSILLVAKEAGDTITAKIYDGEGSAYPIRGASGTDYTGTGVSYTMMEYLDWLLENGETEEERALGRAAKDYCSAAMIYFDYNAEAAEVSSAVDAVTAEALSAYLAGREGTLPAGVTVRGISAMLESDNTLRLYLGFKNAEPSDFTFSIDGNPAAIKQRSDGAYYLATDSGVFSNRLQDEHTYAVSDGTDTYTITASVLTYARSCAVKNSKTESDLGKALYLYNCAAAAAFGE